jgi:SNF2 family DNA or RNA helicase
LCWVGMNDEGRQLAAAIPGAVLVEGSDSPDSKADALAAFARGETRVLVTKTTIAGFGLNFQRCARMVFVGLSDSYEQYFQAIRRCYRFGQARPVVAHIVLTEPEEAIYQNVLRKERDAAQTAAELVQHVAEFEKSELGRVGLQDDYRADQPIRLPSWLQSEPTPIRQMRGA